MAPIILDIKLYNHVKTLANLKFKSKSGIYRSSWIVNTYKKLGGKYSGSKPKLTGLPRWYKEKWVNLYKSTKTGYSSCGRSNLTDKYPLCRPTFRITKKTPKTYNELSKNSIKLAKKQKKDNTYIKFT